MPPLKVGENYLVPLDPRGFPVKAEPGNNFKLLKLIGFIGYYFLKESVFLS
jgi:hypothetical protein